MSTLAGLSDIEIRITADLARLKADMDQARKAVGDAFGGMRGAADSLKGVLGGLFAGLSVTAVSAWVKGAIDAADAMDELSGRVGIGVEELSRLQVAYQMAGLGTDAMQSSLSKLSKGIADGGGAFDTLGIKTRNADGSLRSATAVMGDLADEFQGIKDGSAKTALAMDLFGKSGADMVPLLNSGSEGLREMAKLAEDLGVALDEQTAKRAAEFNDTLDGLGMASKGAATKLASELLPTLNAVAGAMLDGAKGSNVMNGAASLLSGTMKTLYSIGAGVGEVFTTVGTVLGTIVAQLMASLGGVADIFKSLFKGDFAGAGEAFRRSSREVKAIQEESARDMENRWATSGGRIQNVWAETASATAQSAAEMARLQRGLTPKTKEQEEADKAAAAAAKKHAEERARLAAAGQQYLRGLADQSAALRQQLALGRDLTASEKALATLERDLREGKVKLTTAEVERARAQIASNQSLRDAIELQQALVKNEAELAKFAAKSLEDLGKDTAALQEQVKQQREQNDQIGATKEQLQALEQARLDDAIASKQQQIAALEAVGYYPQERAEIEKQIAALREMKVLKEEGGAKTVAVDAATEAQRAWEQTTQSIGQGLTDSLFRAFESGKGFFKTLWDGIQNTFKTTVLKLLISGQDGKGGLMGDIMGLLGMAGGGAQPAGGGGSGGGSFGNTLSAASSLYNWGSSAYAVGGQYLAGTMSGANAAGTLYANAAGTGLDGLLATNGAYGTAGGSSAGAGGMGSMASMWPLAVLAGMLASDKLYSAGWSDKGLGGDAVNWTTKLETKLATMMGVGDKTANILFGAPVQAKLFGRQAPQVEAMGFTGTLGAGDFSGQAYADILENGGIFRSDKRYTKTQELDAELGKTLDEGAAAVLASAKKYAEALGLPVEGLSAVTQTLKVKLTDDIAANKKAINDAMGQYGDAMLATFAPALKGLGLEGETTAATMLRVITNLSGVNFALDQLGLELLGTSVAGGTAATELAALFGGLDQLGAATSDYYARYYTEAERNADVTAAMTAALADVGLQLPTTTEAFRALVEEHSTGQALMTESGREAFSALMSVQAAFHELTSAADASAAATAAAAAEQRAGLEQQLLELQGNTAELRRRELAALDPANRALQEMIWQLQDAADAASKMGKATAGMVDTLQGSFKASDFAETVASISDAQIRQAIEATTGPNRAYLDTNLAVGTSTWFAGVRNSMAASLLAAGDMPNPGPDLMRGGSVSPRSREVDAGTRALVEVNSRLVDALSSFRDQLKYGEFSTLNPTQQYAEARAAFEAVAAQAGAGDQAAAEQLQARSQQFLKLSRGQFGSTEGFAADQTKVTAALDRAVALLERLNSVSEAGVRSNAQALAGVEDATRGSARYTASALDRLRLAEQQGVA